MRKIVLGFLAAFVLAGCASKAEDIAPTYVSPVMYDSFSCSQLSQEAQRVAQAARATAGTQDSKASKDTVKTTIGIIVFWPVLLLNDGDGQTAAQLAQLKGQMQAIEQANIRKKCGLQFKARTS